MVRVSKLSESEIAEQYKSGVRVIDIATLAEVSRQAIFNTLKRTGAHEPDHGKIERVCKFCGEKFSKFKSAKCGGYCSIPCYNADKDGLGYYGKRGTIAKFERESGRTVRSSRVEGRKAIRTGVGEVVHHIDGNPFNNEESNLMTFPDQASHMRHHHAIRNAKHPAEAVKAPPPRAHHMRCLCSMCKPPKP